MNNFEPLYKKALNFEFLSAAEGLKLYRKAPLSELVFVADEIRQNIGKQNNTQNIVGWIIDRNVNITNVCISQCKFCNFYRKYGHEECYITSLDEYREKIEELFELGGNQLLLQGGLHPRLKIDFYEKLFRDLKKIRPGLKLHALGPPEIHHIARISKLSYSDVLQRLASAGLDSLPGAGAEILSDRVRREISPGKCTTQQWLDVMREAHRQYITTSATMMFGHIETDEERIKHLILLREVQAEKPDTSDGFTTFVPWPFQDEATVLRQQLGITNKITTLEYLRLITISRIMLPNIKNIQASWLTVGKETAQLCLHAGANDFGSIMIEENVVSSAGASYQFDAQGIQAAIREAGFEARRRNQQYEYVG